MKTEFIINGEKYPSDAEEFETSWDKDNPEYIAEDAAEHFYDFNDGWEHSWPQEFEIFIDGKSAGAFEVDREDVPTFSASKKQQECDND